MPRKFGSAETIDIMRISGRYSLFNELGYRAMTLFFIWDDYKQKV